MIDSLATALVLTSMGQPVYGSMIELNSRGVNSKTLAVHIRPTRVGFTSTSISLGSHNIRNEASFQALGPFSGTLEEAKEIYENKIEKLRNDYLLKVNKFFDKYTKKAK